MYILGWGSLIQGQWYLGVHGIYKIKNPIFNPSRWLDKSLLRLLPSKLECPGGNASWETVEVKNNARICEGQKNVCNQTALMRKLSVNWDLKIFKISLNTFIVCCLSLQPGIALKTHSAAHMVQGSLSVIVSIISTDTSAWDKWDPWQIILNMLVITSLLHMFIVCSQLQGEFPIGKVLGIITGSTVVVSSLLWFTQRRKVETTWILEKWQRCTRHKMHQAY